MRFKLRTTLLIFAITCAWFATWRLGRDTGAALRSNAWFFLLAIAVLGVVHYREIRRSFWLGFGLALLARAIPQLWPLAKYRPNTSFVTRIAGNSLDHLSSDQQQAYYPIFADSMELLCTIMLSVTCGVVSVVMFRHAQQLKKSDPTGA